MDRLSLYILKRMVADMETQDVLIPHFLPKNKMKSESEKV